MFSKFLDPKNDIAFRKIFGTKANKEILIHFLNDVIPFTGQRPIVEVTFLPTVQDPEIAAQKSSIVDVLCVDDQGATYIVEMQVARERGFEKRAQYYASKAYISQAEVGSEYHTLKEVIFLAIANFTMFKNKKSYKSDHVILDFETHEHDLKDFSFTFIELPKFHKTAKELESMADKWIYFFKHADETSEEELAEISGKDEIIKKAYHELDRYYWTKEERHLYDQAEKHKNAYLASMAQKFDEGKAEGRDAVVRKMIEQRCEDSLIMSVAGITAEQLSQLKGQSPTPLKMHKER